VNRLEYLAAQIVTHQAAAAPHLEAIEALKEAIRAEVGHTPGDHEAGNLKVNIQANNRLNPDKFREAYPPDKFPALYKQVPNTDALPPEVKRSFYTSGKAKVSVK
jgi:hypothetical protein